MKIVGIIFSLLITLISAALFRGFPRGVLSVHHSFGKLMSDVVSNVRQNIDCSIQSMQGILDKGKPYTSNSRCNEQANQRITHSKTIQTTSNPITVNQLTNGVNAMNTIRSFKNDPPKSAVNNTILDIIKKQSTQRKLGEINKVLRSESEQLDNVNVLLKKKIDNISKGVSEELKKIERDHKDPPMEEVIHEIELLREHKQTDSSKVDDVRKIAKEVLNELNTNDTTLKVTTSLEAEELKQIVTDFERYSNNTLKEIEKQFQDWEVVESNQLSSIKNILQTQQLISSNQNRTDDKTRSVKSIAKNIIDGQSVYSDNTSGAIIKNGAELTNKSQTVKYESKVTSTENVAADKPVSLSMNHHGSNIVNKGKLNNLFKILQNTTDSKEIYTISKNSISSHNDSRSDKNSEIIITPTEESGKPNLSSTERHFHMQNNLSADYIHSNLDSGVEIIAMIPSDLSDEEKYMRTKNTLSMNTIIQTNDSDSATESINVLANISSISGNISSVEKHSVTEFFNQINPIDIRSMPTNISLNLVLLPNVSNTNLNNLDNEIDATTESYRSINIDNVLSNTPYLSSMVNIMNPDNAGFSNKINSSVNMDRESAFTDTSTIKNDISDYIRIEQPVTIGSIISLHHDDEHNTEPNDTIMNADDTSTKLNFERMVTTESLFSTNNLSLTEITDNETESIVTSTTTRKIPDVVATENKISTIIINQMYNSIPTFTESLYTSTNTYHNLVDTPAELHAENLVTTENYYTDKIDSNYHSLKNNQKSISNISVNEDITLDISNVEKHMTTANLDAFNYINPDHGSIERTESIQTSTSTYNIAGVPKLNNLVTTESYIFSKRNSNDSNEPAFISKSSITDSIPGVISNEYPASAIQINSTHNMEKLTETSATSTDTVITSVLTAEDTLTNDCINKKSECFNLSTNIDDTSDMSNVGSQMTTEYFIGSNQRNDHIETFTDFSGEQTLMNADDGLIGTKYVSSLNRVMTSESPIFSNKLTSATIHSTTTDDSPDILSSETLVMSPQKNSNLDIENITDSILTSTNVDDLQQNTLNIQENVTTDNSRIDTNFSNGYIYTGTEHIFSSSTNIDDISNVSNVESQISTEYQSNVNIETSTDFSTIYISAHTNNDLAETTGLPRINTQVTTENYFNSIIYTNDDKVEDNESIVSSTYTSDTLDVSSKENHITTETLVRTKFVIPYNNITVETGPTETSTNIGDIINDSSVGESQTLEKPFTMNKMNSNNTFYSNAKFLRLANTDLLDTSTDISSSTTFSNDEIDQESESYDNTSDMFSVDNLETTEYSLTLNEINACFNTLTETSDVPNINTLVTTDNNHFADNIYSYDDIFEDSESILSKEKLATTENLISTYHVDLYSYKAKETDYIDTTDKVDIIHLTDDEEFVSSEKLSAMDEIDASNKIYKRSKFISTSPNTDLLDMPNLKQNNVTESFSSKFYLDDNIDKKTESLGEISKKNSVEKLESLEDVFTTNQINAELHTSTEAVYASAYTDNVPIDTSDVASEYIFVTTDNYQSADSIYSNDDTVEVNESMGTSTYDGGIIDVSSAEAVLSSVKPHTIDKINFNNSIYKNAKSTRTPTYTNSLDTLSFEEIVPTENTSSTIFSNADVKNETDPLARNEFNGTSIRIEDKSIDVSSDENRETTEELISKNHAELYDDFAKEHNPIDASTYKIDILDISDEKEYLTTEKPYTTNDIQSNYDTSEETDSIDSNSGEVPDVSNLKKLGTSYPISAKPINRKINKYTESIDTSSQANWTSIVEQMASTKYHTLSTKQIFTKFDTNTDSTDIFKDSDDKPNVSSLENFLSVKNNPLKRITKQSPSYVSSSEDLKPLSKGKARDQAVKLALNIFEQSKRSQMIMKNVFKNEKHARNLF